jgi:hypothetical protein
MPGSAKAGSFPPHRIFETRQFAKGLAGLEAAAEKHIEAKLRDYVYPILRQNPHFGPNNKRLKRRAAESLEGEEPRSGHDRLRIFIAPSLDLDKPIRASLPSTRGGGKRAQTRRKGAQPVNQIRFF